VTKEEIQAELTEFNHWCRNFEVMIDRWPPTIATRLRASLAEVRANVDIAASQELARMVVAADQLGG
jgi:hypothetical protein